MALLGLALATGCSAGTDQLLQPNSGGDTTTRLNNRNAFGSPAGNLTTEQRRLFEIGDSFFTQPWVTAPSSTDARDGLGPLFNATSCSSCHVLDGRAGPPTDNDDPERGLLLRLGVTDGASVVAHPIYGGQLQDRAIAGVPIEGEMGIEHEYIQGTFGDGSPYELESPSYTIVNPGYGPVGDDLLLSPRIAPIVAGMGLLEAIPEEDILSNADPEDADGDGISGRPNYVESDARRIDMMGRIGWKANVATIEDQVAGAFLGDIGITSIVHPDRNCTPTQAECLDAIDGGSPELTADRLAKVVFYSSTLAVPIRRDLDDSEVQEGAELFDKLGCSACHRPTFTTGDHAIEAIANQTIHPFTDLLLHDMGSGLADGKPDGLATGTEWRTPPLWGIGLVETVNGHTRFLHDGRARSLEEAVLWHGGEAQVAQNAYRLLDRRDRDRVIAFLESL